MTLHICPESWESLCGPWGALVEQVQPAGGVFLTPEFQSAWWSVFGDPAALALHSVRTPDGDLVGVLPLQRRDSARTFIGDPDLCDYADLIALPSAARAVLEAFLIHGEASGVSRLDLWGLPESSSTLALLPELARARGWTLEANQEAVCPTVALPDHWDHYLDGLKGKYRHEVRRKLRHLADGGARVEFTVIEEPEQIAAHLDDLFDLMRASRADKADFLTDQREEFFRALVRNLAPRRWTYLYLMHLDGVRVAALLGFNHGTTLLLYNSGYDPAYRDRAVGLASKVFCVRDSIQRGKRHLNFLRGEEDYKYQLGGVPSPVMHFRLTR